MNRFKVGDKVVLINADRYTHRNSEQVRKLLGQTLIVRSVDYNELTPAVFAGLPGDGCWHWYPEDLQLVPESDASPTPGKRFQVGDYVVVIAGPDKSDKVHVVTESGDSTYPLRVAFCTYTTDGRLLTCGTSSCMRHATIQEITAMQKPKVLHRGDLVEYLDEVWVVTHGTVPTDMFAKISSMTGKERTRWVAPDAVVLVGDILKKVKRLKAQMGDEK